MLRLSEIMTRDVVCVTPETTLREAVELFTAKHISGAPVVCGHEVVGVVAASDILAFAASTSGAFGEAADGSESSEIDSDTNTECREIIPGSYYTDLFTGAGSDLASRIGGPGEPALLDAHTVDEVMTRTPIALSPNDSVLSAADSMRARSIHRVLVIEHGKLVGIISTVDLARAVADRRFTTTRYVFTGDRRSRRRRFPF